jgi:zinc finger SWIM domain-containing protein 3
MNIWVAAYMTKDFWLGMKSNQQSESLNSCLHLHLDGEMTLVYMILHYENCITRIRENEAHDDCTVSQTLPVPITSCRELEVFSSHVFTPANFYICDLCNQFNRGSLCLESINGYFITLVPKTKVLPQLMTSGISLC